MKTIACPRCGSKNDYDPEKQSVIVCDYCDGLIFIPEEDATDG